VCDESASDFTFAGPPVFYLSITFLNPYLSEGLWAFSYMSITNLEPLIL
jgi:hypothetical protein